VKNVIIAHPHRATTVAHVQTLLTVLNANALMRGVVSTAVTEL